jgi:hypothetical protein
MKFHQCIFAVAPILTCTAALFHVSPHVMNQSFTVNTDVLHTTPITVLVHSNFQLFIVTFHPSEIVITPHAVFLIHPFSFVALIVRSHPATTLNALTAPVIL